MTMFRTVDGAVQWFDNAGRPINADGSARGGPTIWDLGGPDGTYPDPTFDPNYVPPAPPTPVPPDTPIAPVPTPAPSPGTAAVRVHVTNAATGAPIAGATVLSSSNFSGQQTHHTDASGSTSIVAAVGELIEVNVLADGFASIDRVISVPSASGVDHAVALTSTSTTPQPQPQPSTTTLVVQVSDRATGAPIAGATVLTSSDVGGQQTHTTDASGSTSIVVGIGHLVQVTIVAAGYENNDRVLTIPNASSVVHAVTLAHPPPAGVPPVIIIKEPGNISPLDPPSSIIDKTPGAPSYTRASVETRSGVPSLTADSFSTLDVGGFGSSPGGLLSTIIGGLIGLFRGSSGGGDLGRLTGIVQNMGQFVLQLAQTVSDLTSRSTHTDGQTGNVLEHILGAVLGPVINALAAVIRGGSTDLAKLFGPISDSLKKLLATVRHLYDVWLRPIIHAIDVTRQILRVLESFHLEWAAAADRALGKLEGKLNAPIQLAIKEINATRNVVNRIVTLDGAVQRIALIKGMVKSAGCVQNVWWNSQTSKPGQYAKTELDPTPTLMSVDEFSDAIGAAVNDDAGPFAVEARRLDALVGELSA